MSDAENAGRQLSIEDATSDRPTTGVAIDERTHYGHVRYAAAETTGVISNPVTRICRPARSSVRAVARWKGGSANGRPDTASGSPTASVSKRPRTPA